MWRICVPPCRATGPWGSEVLTSDERERARNLRTPVQRDRYCAAHTALRYILASYIQCHPGDLGIGTSSTGKPLVSRPTDGQRLKFNLSHSGRLALLAVSRIEEVGIDVEEIRSSISHDAFAARVFTSHEAEIIQCAPRIRKRQLFFRCWTRKEALVKATGYGLRTPLDTFDVHLESKGPVTLSDPDAQCEYTLVDLDLGPAYSGAVAVRGQTCRLRLTSFAWPPLGTPNAIL